MPTTSCGAGRTPASTCCTARRPGSGSRPRPVATATTSSAAGAATRCSRAPSPPSSPAGWVASTVSSRSGTACRGSRRSGATGHASRSSTMCTARCGTRSCRGPLAGLGRALETRVGAAVLPPDPGRHAQRFDARRVAGDRVRTGTGDRRRQRRRTVLHARRAALRHPDDRRHRPAGTGQTLRVADRGRRRGPGHDPRPASADHRRGARTRRPRGLDPTPRRRIVGHARRLRAARPAGRASTGGRGSSPAPRSPRGGDSPSPRPRRAAHRPSRPTSRAIARRSSTA